MKTNSRRKVLKMLFGAVAGIGATFAAVPFIRSFNPSEKAKADRFSYVDIKIDDLNEGEHLVFKELRRPLIIVRRSRDILNQLKNTNPNLADPESNESIQPKATKNSYRSIIPEVFVTDGICTHLPCSVNYQKQDKSRGFHAEGGFFCPCHGSVYDHAGRVHKNMPAPTNLTIPEYEMINENTIRVRVDSKDWY